MPYRCRNSGLRYCSSPRKDDDSTPPPSAGEVLDAAMAWHSNEDGTPVQSDIEDITEFGVGYDDEDDDENFARMLQFGDEDDEVENFDDEEEMEVMQIMGQGKVIKLSNEDEAAAVSTVLEVLQEEKKEYQQKQLFEMDEQPWLQSGSNQKKQSSSVKKSPDKGSSTLPRRHTRPPVPIVAILGRPNVGKSALANRISGKYTRGAIVHDEVGVTRDRTYLRSEFIGKTFDVVDTGGLIFDDDQSSLFLEQIRQQAAIALTEAAAAILVVDGQIGRTALDEQVAEFLRKEWAQRLKVVVAVTKCESITVGDMQAAEFWSLGLGEPFPVSGIHGTGVAELLEVLAPHLYDVSEEQLSQEEILGKNTVSIALVGRPNVGKSSMFNRLYGEARAIVSEVAGTTRDTLDAELEKDGRIYKFIDTAGIRRKGKVQYGSEFFMVNRALKVSLKIRCLELSSTPFILT